MLQRQWWSPAGNRGEGPPQELRCVAAEYIIKYPESTRYSEINLRRKDLSTLTVKQLKEGAARRAKALKTTKCQGGDFELHAISKSLGREIIVHNWSKEKNEYLEGHLEKDGNQFDLPPLHIAFKNKHYTALVKVTA